MLERALRLVLRMTRQMYLAVFSHQIAGFVDQDRGVEVPRPAVLDAQFRIPQIQAYTKPPRLIEQRLGRIVRHAALEPGVDFRLVFHKVAREECGQRKLWKDDELAVARRGLAQQREQAFDDDSSALVLGDGAELRGADGSVRAIRSYLSIGLIMRPRFLPPKTCM